MRRVADLMAQYGLNVFHVHLTQDDGWRLEIHGLLELTEAGARRHRRIVCGVSPAQPGATRHPAPSGRH